jgi:carboxypeptidase PM20D1
MPHIAEVEQRERLERLRSEVAGEGLERFLVTSFDSIYYLTGVGFEPLERPFFLVVSPPGGEPPTLLVPRLDAEHMKKARGVNNILAYWDCPSPAGRGWADGLPGLLGAGRRVGVEPSLRLDVAEALCEFSPVVRPLVERLRLVKSASEVAMIRRAARHADRAVEQLLDASYRGATVAEGFARTGTVTRAILREVDDWEPLTTRVLMATWAAPRSAQPHSVPALGDRLGSGPHVALALLRINGYAAESERTYFTTRPTPEMQRAFRAMLEARAVAFRMIRPGAPCGEIDAAVGEFLRAEGYDGEERRLHRTGHGIGLGNHEAPWIAAGSDDVLAENMVVSIEPGVYLGGGEPGGYRHSDTVLVTRDGCEPLTRMPTDLRSLTLTGWSPGARLRGALVRRALRPESHRALRHERDGSLARTGPNAVGGDDRRPRMRALIGTVLALLGVGLIGVVGVVVFRTIASRSRQLTVTPVRPRDPLRGYAERLSGALQFRTIAAGAPGTSDPAQFVALRAFLEREFPTVHRQLTREVIGGHTLLFQWHGSDRTVEPILLMSHLDVVPAETDAGRPWTHPPFSGRIANGYIWGRGALDVKCGALGLLEAVERLLADGFRPSGDVYFALGHDEEAGGREGNRRAAELLHERGVRFRFVLDEGGGLTQGIIEGIKGPVAFVGVAEKGYATVKLTARAEGGHSSMPPPHTAVGMVAAAVARLESNPFPARIDGATVAMLDFLGPEMPWPRRVALANRWLTGGIIASQFASKPSMNAQIRTTMAATIVRGGETANVLPKQAEAFVNLRLLPGDTSKSALRRIEADVRRLGFDERSFTCLLETALSEPSRVSSMDSDGFRTLQRTIAEIYPRTVVAPGLSMVATDSRYYDPIASDIYRFLPLRVTNDDLKRIHGLDERIGIKTYEELIGFLARLIENLSGPATAQSPVRPSVR